MIIILSFLALLYGGLLLFFRAGMQRLSPPQDRPPQQISIIVAARNEEEHLPQLLDALLHQDYPTSHYEIIVADDRSTDKTPTILQKYAEEFPHLKWVKITQENPNFVGKKGALTAAIAQSTFPILTFTDADCLPTRHWLSEVNRHFHPHTDFLAGYSPLIVNNPRLNSLKNLERSSIFAVTAGSLGWNWGITCAARNMAYRRSLYDAVRGFSTIGHIRSGDDDLMLQRLAPHCRSMNFMFSPASTIPSYDTADAATQLQLEQRRGSKLRYYTRPIQIMAVGAAVFYVTFLAGCLGALLGKVSLPAMGAILLWKLFSEGILVSTFLKKVQRPGYMKAFLLAELLYIPYYLYFGIKGTFGAYRWKN